MSWRISVGLSLLAAVIFSASSAPRAADESKHSQPGHLVAILDYDQVFQNSQRYKTELDQLKNDTAKTENELKGFNEQVYKLEEGLKGLLPSSPDFIKKQEEVTLKKHELQARIQIERMKFEQQRVKLETKVLNEIDSITQQLAVDNNIAMVQNVSTQQSRWNNLDATERHRQRPVVFFNSGLDLTSIVLSKINTSYQAESKLTAEERAAKAAGPKRPPVTPDKADKK